MSNTDKKVVFKVFRYNPDVKKPSYDSFEIPLKHGMTVLDGLIYIKERLDNTLTFRYSCRMSSCGSCGMVINGRPMLACYTQIASLGSATVTVEPQRYLPLIKDLVVDDSEVYMKHRAVKPFLVRIDKREQDEPTLQYLQSEAELEEYLQFAYCIKCGLCLSACPVFGRDEYFIGPMALAQAYRYFRDSRDELKEARLELVSGEGGIWECTFVGECSNVCPKHVDPSLAIQRLKVEGGLLTIRRLFRIGGRRR